MNNMTTLLAILITLIVIVATMTTWLKKGKRTTPISEENWPYYAKKPLSQPEQILYHRLVNALPEHIILAQVQLSRVLGVKKGFNYGEWNNRINRMSIDFVICHKDSSIVAAIELDDKTHEQESRKEADSKKNKALESANIRLIRWKTKEIPNKETIQKTIKELAS